MVIFSLPFLTSHHKPLLITEDAVNVMPNSVLVYGILLNDGT
ncbi:hypothetical protein [Vibrio vulnificus YJ016]|uniref:Uncharacterized protein n=1 Tax=Vibrio vulnificus (strain YJ016) TaxID=196600 RepID=Q7MI61_VIBVY|nr:hypothetical protein [Vibrio vulnificus YJ016]